MMKLVYLIHSESPYEELQELISQLIKQGDHVCIMINSDELRDQIAFTFMDDKRVHISQKQMYAQEGDLSMSRGTLMQIRDALDCGQEFDYFINLSEGMVPLKSRDEILSVLEAHPDRDFYYVARDEKQDPSLRKKTEKYYPFTNIISFPQSRFVRAMTKAAASLLYALHVRRVLEDEIQIGSPWFILTEKSAKLLAENYSYCSTTFKLSWYAEEMYIPMMMKKFAPDRHERHINSDLRIIGEGRWKESRHMALMTEDALSSDEKALFGGSISAEKTPGIYTRFFDIYNRNSE